jgi:hypothetical protein
MVQRYYNLRSKGHVNYDPSTSQPDLCAKTTVVTAPPKKLVTTSTSYMNMDYNVIENMKKMKENISLFTHVTFLNKDTSF